MRFARRLAAVALLGGLLSQAVGCHNLQEHRRMRWNYGPGMSAGTDPYSVIWDRAAVERLS